MNTAGLTSDELLWLYNCRDCVHTRECGEVETDNLKALGLIEQDAFQQKMFWPVLEAMKLGVRIDTKRRAALAMELLEELGEREAWFYRVLGHAFNPKSPTQMAKLMYDDLQMPVQRKRGRNGVPGSITCGDEALRKIAYREPLLLPLLRKISEYRSIGVFLSTFVMASLDQDGRMRTSYNICGTETFRLSSSENAFGSGTNLQNVPKGGEDEDDILQQNLKLPNIREIFIPDPEHTMFDTDLSKADLTIVAWEGDVKEMKAMLKEGRDPYVETAREYYRDPTITKLKADGVTVNARYDQFKRFGHGTHYLGTPQGLAGRIGLSVAECERAQRWYFGKYPEIKSWHTRTIEHIKAKRFVQNVFGNRRYYFDRIDDSVFREAIAWIPQSTVALYINRIWLNLWEQARWIAVLLQVHDSLVGQFPSMRRVEAMEAIRKASQIELPYPGDPLIIKLGIKTSDKSWGACG